jgi:hypothetical protein
MKLRMESTVSDKMIEKKFSVDSTTNKKNKSKRRKVSKKLWQ